MNYIKFFLTDNVSAEICNLIHRAAMNALKNDELNIYRFYKAIENDIAMQRVLNETAEFQLTQEKFEALKEIENPKVIRIVSSVARDFSLEPKKFIRNFKKPTENLSQKTIRKENIKIAKSVNKIKKNPIINNLDNSESIEPYNKIIKKKFINNLSGYGI